MGELTVVNDIHVNVILAFSGRPSVFAKLIFTLFFFFFFFFCDVDS